MNRAKQRIHLIVLVVAAACLAGTAWWNKGNTRANSTSTAHSASSRPKEAAFTEDLTRMHIYLLIGASNMAGMAEMPDQGEIQGCSLLNRENQWEPARSPLNRYSSIDQVAASRQLGPGPSFAQTLIARTDGLRLGLVVNAGGEEPVDDWLGKSKLYWGARGRTKAAIQSGDLKGVLWIPGRSDSQNPAGYHQKLIQLIGQFRSDLSDSNLPFVLAGLPGADPLNQELIKATGLAHATGFIDTGDLAVNGSGHFDAASQTTLGKRFAEEMVRLRASLPAPPQPPTDLQPIDPHVHAMSVTPLGLRSVAQWMDDRNVEQCIVSPLNHKGSRPQNDEEYQTMLELFRPYKDRIHRMCILDAGEVKTVEEALAILRKEIADGVVGFGEHYGMDLMFDDPQNLLLYEACEKAGLPVMFHIDQNKNMVTPGMPEVDRVLKQFPRCNLVAHAYWWRQLRSGACDRQLAEHPNLYADMSGKVVVEQLNRDRAYAREFLIRHQDKILWATDEGWWSFGGREKQMNQHYTILEELDLPDEVRRKVYRDNALKVYGLAVKRK